MYNNYSNWDMGDIGGPSISGQWVSKRTGESILVRDSIIMDNDMSVILSDGRTLSMEEFSRDYIQMSEEEYDIGGQQISSSNSNSNTQINNPSPGGVSGRYKDTNTTIQLPPEPLEQPDYDFGNIEEDFYDEVPLKTSTNNKQDSPNFEMVRKLFENTNPEILVDVSMQTKKFPVDEIKMLINIFGVSPSEISEYIFNQYFNTENIVKAIEKYLTEKVGLVFDKPEIKEDE